MKKKGLCITCAQESLCGFPRRFPVWQCEEFSIDTPFFQKRKKKKGKKK